MVVSSEIRTLTISITTKHHMVSLIRPSSIAGTQNESPCRKRWNHSIMERQFNQCLPVHEGLHFSGKCVVNDALRGCGELSITAEKILESYDNYEQNPRHSYERRRQSNNTERTPISRAATVNDSNPQPRKRKDPHPHPQLKQIIPTCGLKR